MSSNYVARICHKHVTIVVHMWKRSALAGDLRRGIPFSSSVLYTPPPHVSLTHLLKRFTGSWQLCYHVRDLEDG